MDRAVPEPANVKILIVSNYFYPEHIGGVEVVADNLATHYRRAGHEVRMVAADVPPSFRRAQPGDVPLRAWNLAEARLGFPYPIPGPAALPELWRQVDWCDVVHAHDSLYISSALSCLMARVRGRPVLITQHAKTIAYEQPYRRWLQTIAYHSLGRFVLMLAGQVIFVSAPVHDEMVRFVKPSQKARVVLNGVDTGFFAPLDSEARAGVRKRFGLEANKPLVLFVGRMVERKGVHLLRPIIEAHGEWNWILVGRQDDIDPGSWGLPNLLHLTPVSRETLRDLYAAADVLLHPSTGEGITLTAREAVSCGTPVILSAESLASARPEDNAAFIPAQRDSQSLEAALGRALRAVNGGADTRLRLREHAVSTLSWEGVAAEYLKYLQVLHKGIPS